MLSQLSALRTNNTRGFARKGNDIYGTSKERSLV